ncbi:uncharacterized protein LOC128290675 isoform X2 [Gossypium arboreum]|uniref:uncharacterized protein LOC128290675 isoform X2 n=1 Tax=Gossypium arboreum TaxID=29729 RepID=UPI0022F19A63|nr:uncharacterized protein LOC128290675 isoform X2 [Gossypium arboreum]
MNFQQNLMEAMGQNVHFVIDSWMEEWKGKETPHTTGCNFFECQQIDGKLIIRSGGVSSETRRLGAELLTRSEGTHERIIKLLEMSVAYNNN